MANVNYVILHQMLLEW